MNFGMNFAIPLHVLSVVIWVGGMFFAHMVLRPTAVESLEPPLRLRLWRGVFGRFFPWVWLCILLILASGFWMIFGVYGGMGGLALHVHLMFGMGLVMMLVFFYIFFVPYAALKKAVAAENWPAGGQALAGIRRLVTFNLVLGLLTVIVSTGGVYWNLPM
ncbi:CopD family protein [Thiolapillus brandeum]|nr:CopD family protein [Thiolapillus brandeum]